MKLLFIVLSLSLLYLAQGQQFACCAPPQWEGDVAGFFEKQNESIFEYISYDFANRRIRVDLYEFHHTEHKRVRKTLIEKEIGGQAFVYDIEPDGSCTYKKANRPVQQICVRSGYTHKYDITLGVELEASFYVFESDLFVEDLMFTRKTCVPIRGLVFEHHGREYKFDAEFHFWNIELGIRNPNIFFTPLNCKLVTN